MPPWTYAIDFGTSNSLLAATDGQKIYDPIPLDPFAPDPTILKSVLYTPAAGQCYFGAQAIQQYSEHLAEGRLFRSLKKHLPDASFKGTTVHQRFYNLSDLIALFLKELRERGNQHFNQDCTRVVLGRPARFAQDHDGDALAENRLRAAAQIAGFKEVLVCPEPVAAAYEFRHQLDQERTVLIADFGGGTSDYTVLRLGPKVFRDQDILATHGVALAGDSFDGVLMKHMIAPHFGTEVVYRLPTGRNDLRLPQHIVNRLCSAADIAFLSRSDIMQLLKDAQKWSLKALDSQRMNRLFTLIEEQLGYKIFREIEQTKISLSSVDESVFRFDYPGLDLEEKIRSQDFVDKSAVVVERITTALDETLKRAGVQPAQIDIVCCTGGTAKLPALDRQLKARFGAEKLRQHQHFHSVVKGLAERALAEPSAP